LILIDKSNRDFKSIMSKYEVSELPYYLVLQRNKILSRGQSDNVLLDVLASNFKNHNVRELKDTISNRDSVIPNIVPVMDADLYRPSISASVPRSSHKSSSGVNVSSESPQTVGRRVVGKREVPSNGAPPNGVPTNRVSNHHHTSDEFDRQIRNGKANIYSPTVPYLNGYEKQNGSSHQNPNWEYSGRNKKANINAVSGIKSNSNQRANSSKIPKNSQQARIQEELKKDRQEIESNIENSNKGGKPIVNKQYGRSQPSSDKQPSAEQQDKKATPSTEGKIKLNNSRPSVSGISSP
jgi:hypothetical protein